MKEKNYELRKEVKYYYPNGDLFESNSFIWYFIQISAFIFLWILSPLIFPFYWYYECRGTKKIKYYMKEIK